MDKSFTMNKSFTMDKSSNTKTPFVSREKIEEIMKVYPTPFYLYDEKGILENARNLYQAFSWCEGFREYFAVKATPNPEILRLLKAVGCGVDCSSFAELKMSEICGFSGDDIMFSSNETPVEEFEYANKLNAIINLDDITHIEYLKNNGGIPKKICLRFNPGGDFKIGTSFMGKPGEAKYGMMRAQLREAIKILKNEGVNEFGLHSFLASNTLGNEYYPALAKLMFEVVLDLSKEEGVTFSFVNLSGGIGIPYKLDEKPNDIFLIGEKIKEAYDEIIKKNGLKLKIFTELGRFMLAPFGALITKVIHEKHIYKEYIGVDACSVNLMRPMMYGAYHHITVLGKEKQKEDHVYDIVGNLCENSDKFAIDRKLPKIELGDILFIHDTGAHGFSMGYNYNGRLRSAEILLKKNGDFKLIRRKETIDDYFRTLSILPGFEEYK